MSTYFSQLKVKKIDFNELNIQKKLLDIECSSSSLCFGIPVLRENFQLNIHCT